MEEVAAAGNSGYLEGDSVREYKLTDGRSVVIERAKSETLARVSAAKRLECEPEDLRRIATKKLPKTWREKKEEKYDIMYAEYLLGIQRQQKSADCDEEHSRH